MKVQVYDSHGYFEPMLQRYLSGASKKPLSHFVIGFGQRIMSNNADHSGLLISAQVNHSRSQHRLNQVRMESMNFKNVNEPYSWKIIEMKNLRVLSYALLGIMCKPTFVIHQHFTVGRFWQTFKTCQGREQCAGDGGIEWSFGVTSLNLCSQGLFSLVVCC